MKPRRSANRIVSWREVKRSSRGGGSFAAVRSSCESVSSALEPSRRPGSAETRLCIRSTGRRRSIAALFPLLIGETRAILAHSRTGRFLPRADMEKTAPRLLIPQLRGFYEWAEPISWVLIRLTLGRMIIPHGWPKLMMGVTKTAEMALIKRGIQPAEPL